MKKILLAGLLLFVIAVIVVTWFPQSLVKFGINGQINRVMPRDELLEEKEGIHVFTVGTGSPMPGNRAQTGTAVFVNGHFFMFDVGAGVVQKAENLNLPLHKLDGIFITHWHSDHFIDLPYLISRSWVLGRNNDLHIYASTGLDTIMQAVNNLLSIENRYRVLHHGKELMDTRKATAIPHLFELKNDNKKEVYNVDGIRITAFKVDHFPIEPAVGYVIEYNGKKVVISGDTKSSKNLMEIAKGADLLFHEVILSKSLKLVSEKFKESGNTRNRKILMDIQDYHTPPSEVAELAQNAGVKSLVLHHFAPSPDNIVIKNLYKNEMKAYKGKLFLANDGDAFFVK